jgi:TetR/AcrR family transcriptional regulator
MTFREPSARTRLLQAALEEFSQLGPGGARTSRIAAKAGINKQLIHYYFGTKERLYQAVLSGTAADVATALRQLPLVGLTAVERLRRLVRGQFDFFASHLRHTAVLVHARSSGPWADDAIQPLVELLVEGQATGFFRDDVDPLTHARQALILHLGFFAIRPVTVSWGSDSIWRDRTAELVVRGCTW